MIGSESRSKAKGKSKGQEQESRAKSDARSRSCAAGPRGLALLAAFGYEYAPAGPGLNKALAHEYLHRAARCRAGDAVRLGEPIQARHLLSRQKLTVGDLLAQVRRNSQIGRN